MPKRTCCSRYAEKQCQWAEAEAEYRRALELNPTSVAAHFGLASWLLCQGRTEEALACPVPVSWTRLGIPALASGGFGSAPADTTKPYTSCAASVLEKVVSASDHSPGAVAVLVRAYAHAGRRTDALRLLAEMKRRKLKGYVAAGAFVNGYLGLGDYDQAFAWLGSKQTFLQFLKVHPFFDPLRGGPRLAELVRRDGPD